MGHDQRFKEFLHRGRSGISRCGCSGITPCSGNSIEVYDTQLPIFPIVVYLRGGKRGLTTEEYRTALFGREILRFRYMAIEMAPLDAEVYREGGGPVGAALSALMDHPKAADPVELRFSMVKQVAESELAALPKFLLVHIIAVYFELTAEEMQRYWRLVSRKEYRKVQEVELTWADKLIEQGRQEGAEKGRGERA